MQKDLGRWSFNANALSDVDPSTTYKYRHSFSLGTTSQAILSGPYIDPHCRVRHDKVDKAGTVTLRHNSQLHHIGVGRSFAGTPVTLLVDDLHIRIIQRHTGELIRELTLDPTRDFQPRGIPPGPPKKKP